MCGEHFHAFLAPVAAEGSSPRVRGTPSGREACSTTLGIIPACAGNTRGTPYAPYAVRDHPRVCGEHITATEDDHIIPWIIPACAGNTSMLMRVMPWPWDHPRVCGEHRRHHRARSVQRGSSPRVRGTRQGRRHRRDQHGIIPACAGNTLSFSPIAGGVVGSSPRVRGTPRTPPRIPPPIGIIPACAGNTGIEP